MPVILSARIPVHLLFTKEVKRKRRISGDNYLRLQTFWVWNNLAGKFSPSWRSMVTPSYARELEICRHRSDGNHASPQRKQRVWSASSDEEQRQACVAYYRHLFNKINALQANKVLALALQAAPLATNPNVMQATDAFARSLKEIASWDWPCKLVLEHCDAMTSSSPERLLPLENVLEVITDYDISICINWARSAIEGRNTTLPLTHTQMAKQAGKLGALMFSGTTLNGAYGEWQDLHAPFAPFCAESLMTTDHVRELFNVAESSTLHFAGIKLLEINATADVHHRIEILRNGIHSLNESR